ncbi:hypothetical protein [Saccharopolyspora phatthalungensis]|uniref:Uncharacterized protein n=1 Tax=Saccharopolyspora phatthalungensis TaxID=664693 RepID=A0A840Q8N6_9PSEU|nr:hypothetical protein [Saccharopolyspora phatthalungensis]MBB5154979.1 hypothetical protein [Saccharopolyspora phatthalungensis]
MSCDPTVDLMGGTFVAYCPCGWNEEHPVRAAAERAAARHPAPVPVWCLKCAYEPPRELFERYEAGEFDSREEFDDHLDKLHRQVDGAHSPNWFEECE